MKTTIINVDILKHERKGAIFLKQFFYFFSEPVQKGRKAQKQSFKDVPGTMRSRNFKQTNKQKISKSTSRTKYLEQNGGIQ